MPTLVRLWDTGGGLFHSWGYIANLDAIRKMLITLEMNISYD